MKLKRIIPLVAILLLVGLALTSCGALDFERDVAEEVKQSKDNLQVTELAGYKGQTIVDRYSTSNVVIWKQTGSESTTYRIVNVATMEEYRTVTYTAADIAKLKEMGITEPIVANRDYVNRRCVEITTLSGDSLRYTLLTLQGKVIQENAESKPIYRLDCIQIGTTVYRMDTATYEVKETFERSELEGKLPSCVQQVGDYYYDYTEGGKYIKIYDEEFHLLTEHRIPSYARGGGYYVFNDGYVVVQYILKVDATEEQYDVYIDALQGRFNIVTLRINPKNGKTQELNTDFILVDVQPVLEKDGEDFCDGLYGDSIQNYVEVMEIKDRMLDTEDDHTTMYDLNSKLSGKRAFTLDGEEIGLYPSYYGNGYVVISSKKTDHRWLLNSKGKIIGRIDAIYRFTDRYMISSDAIYDYELNRLTDLNAPNDTGTMTYYSHIGTKLFFRSNGTTPKYYYFNGTQSSDGTYFHLVGDENTIDMRTSAGIYGVKDGINYRYYDGAGTLLFTSHGSTVYEFVYTEDYVIVQVRGADNDNHYYRIDR